MRRIRSAPSASPNAELNVHAGLQMREYATIADRIAADKPSSVLDWGCGHGQMSSLLRSRGLATTSYDFRPDGDGELHTLEKYPEIQAHWGADQVRLPYDTGAFDAVLSCGVLEHVEYPAASLDELRRVLKLGGTLYVYKLPSRASWTEWVARRLGGRIFYHGMATHDRLYHLQEARALVERSAFRVAEARYTNVLPFLLPLRFSERAIERLWALNRWLSRLPGLRRLANNVELVARAT